MEGQKQKHFPKTCQVAPCNIKKTAKKEKKKSKVRGVSFNMCSMSAPESAYIT